jgi:hypothetical protein
VAVSITKAGGLNTQPNELDTAPGSLAVAENVVISRDGVIEVDRGFEDFSTNLPDFTPAQLISIGGTAYLHLDTFLWYNDSGTWRPKTGSATGGGTDFAYSSGKLYILDPQSYVVRSLDLTTGAHLVVAGNPGSSGTADGTKTAARFTALGCCWFDGSSNLYVTDQHAIRRVNVSTGVVTTVCGAVGTAGDDNTAAGAARFTSLSGIFGDGTYLYVNDLNTNGKIKKIDIATFTPATLATPGAFATASRMAYDGTYVYYKSSATVIQKCDKSSGATSTLLTVASGAARDVFYASGYVYYTLTSSRDEVWRAAVSNAATSFVTLLDSVYSNPRALYVDSSGDIYFCAYGTSTDVVLKAYAGFGSAGASSGSSTVRLLQRGTGSVVPSSSNEAYGIIVGPS